MELGLLKGHHPLMKDVNISLPLLRERGFNEEGNNKLLDFGQKDISNNFRMDPISEMPGQNVVTTTPSSGPMIQSQTDSGHEGTIPQKMNSTKVVDENSLDAVSMTENEESAVKNDKGQVLQTAQLVLNMLEVSMPGIFVPEQKEKVISQDRVLYAEICL